MLTDNCQNHPESIKQIPNGAEAREVCLADISGVHSAILDLERAHSLPPLSFPPKAVLSAGILQSALKAYPIWVTRAKEKFTCVGNVRLYRLAMSCLAPNEEIPVLIIKSRKRDVIKTNYFSELYALSAVLASSLDDVRRLYEAWENNKDNQLFKSAFPLRTKTAFADAFRVSSASLKKKKKP